MNADVKEIVQTFGVAVGTAIAIYVNQIMKSRTSQGKRMGDLEDRTAYLEGHLGIKRPEKVNTEH